MGLLPTRTILALVTILLNFLCAYGRADGATPAAHQPEYTTAEEFVLEKVVGGGVADLVGRFPNEGDRQLHGWFLERLLTDSLPGVIVHPRGIRIIGAEMTEGVNLRSADIRHEVWIDHCKFQAKVILDSAHFYKSLSFDGSTFQSAEFPSLKVDGSLDLRGTVFTQRADLSGMKVGDDFRAERMQFKGYLKSLKVGHDAMLTGANLTSVDFRSAQVGGELNAEGATFGGDTIGWSLAVNGPASFNGANFNGSLSLAGARFADLDISGGPHKFVKLPRLDLSGVEVTKELHFGYLRVGGLVADQLSVKGPLSFHAVNVATNASLRQSHFSTVSLRNVSWPNDPGSIVLEGMTYDYITVDDNQTPLGSFPKLFALAQRASFSPTVYSNLEDFLRREGYPELADQVFVARKQREQRDSQGFEWVRNFALDWFVGYGRHPEYAFYWSVPFLVFGAWVFRDANRMRPMKTDAPKMRYSAWWYSIDLFLPFVDLYAAEEWVPKEGRRFAHFYRRVHTLVGWVMIPLGLAAITGIIK